MAFPAQEVLTPNKIGRIDHYLLDETDGTQGLRYNLDILDQNGDLLRRRSGDEVPHLTATQISNLQSFMTSRRTNLPADLGWTAGHTPGRLIWRFRDGDGTNPSRSLYARVVELDGDGMIVQVHVIDDQPNLSSGQVTAALDFLDTQRAKAVAQILG